MADDDLLKAEKQFRNRKIFAPRRKGFTSMRVVFLLLCVLVGCGVLGVIEFTPLIELVRDK